MSKVCDHAGRPRCFRCPHREQHPINEFCYIEECTRHDGSVNYKRVKCVPVKRRKKGAGK